MSAPKKITKRKYSLRNVTTSQNIPLFLIVLAFTVGFCTHLVFTVIFAESKNEGVIHACVRKRSGEIRIITEYKEYREGKKEKERREQREDANGCRENEIAMEWNIQGVQGPAGNGGGGNSFPFICLECSLQDSIIGNSLTGKNLSGSILLGSSFHKSNLTDVNFSEAKLENVSFTETDLSKVNFEKANLKNAEIVNANLTEVNWNNTICPDGTNSDDHGNTCINNLTLQDNGE